METKFCPLIKDNCVKEKCAMWEWDVEYKGHSNDSMYAFPLFDVSKTHGHCGLKNG